MKRTKQIAGAIIAAAAIFSLGLTTYAEENPPLEVTEYLSIESTSPPINAPTEPLVNDGENPTSDPLDSGAETPPTVYALEELQAAVEQAEDGDTILIGQKIWLVGDTVVGCSDKTLTLLPSTDFSGSALFFIIGIGAENQEIALQNLILDGKQNPSFSAVECNVSGSSFGNFPIWEFENITVQSFDSDSSPIEIANANAVFRNCNIADNVGRRSGGLEIHSTATAEIINCTFTDNRSQGFGAAIRCRGQAKITNSRIVGNGASNANSVQNSGGVYVDSGAICEIALSSIIGNSADMGGGIGCFGTLNLYDTLIYGNTAQLGGSDIRGFGGCSITVTYTENMEAIYTDNDPVGFYADDFEHPFHPETNITTLVGESFEVVNNENPHFGVCFLFSNDLPAPTPEPDENDNTEPIPPVQPSPDDESAPPIVDNPTISKPKPEYRPDKEPNYSPEIDFIPVPESEVVEKEEVTPQPFVTVLENTSTAVLPPSSEAAESKAPAEELTKAPPTPANNGNTRPNEPTEQEQAKEAVEAVEGISQDSTNAPVWVFAIASISILTVCTILLRRKMESKH